MRKRAIFVLPFFAISLLRAEDFRKTLPGVDALQVENRSGYIHVSGASSSQLEVTAHVWSQDHSADAESRIQQIVRNPPISQEGHKVILGRGMDDQLAKDIVIEYDIVAPQRIAVDLHTASGAIRLERIVGPISGDIQVEDGLNVKALMSDAGSLRLHGVGSAHLLLTKSGDIEVQQSGDGEIHAQTGSGTVRGAVIATTNAGDIEIEGRIASPWAAETHRGSVRVTVGPSAKFNLDAATDAGVVRVSQMNSSSPNAQDKARVPVNGGGPEMHLRTGSGDIEVR